MGTQKRLVEARESFRKEFYNFLKENITCSRFTTTDIKNKIRNIRASAFLISKYHTYLAIRKINGIESIVKEHGSSMYGEFKIDVCYNFLCGNKSWTGYELIDYDRVAKWMVSLERDNLVTISKENGKNVYTLRRV